MLRTEKQKQSSLRLGRSFLREAAEMLIRPLAGWIRMGERGREQYVGRSSASVESEHARQESEQRDALSKPGDPGHSG